MHLSTSFSRTCVLLITLTVLIAAAQGLSVRSTPVVVKSAANSSISALEGIVACQPPIDPRGRVLDVRVNDCTKLPCNLIVDQSYTLEIDFIPSTSHNSLIVYVAIIIAGNDYPVINQDVPIPVEGGKPYMVQFPVLITPGFGSGLITIRVMLGGGEVVEVCGLGTAQIQPQ